MARKSPISSSSILSLLRILQIVLLLHESSINASSASNDTLQELHQTITEKINPLVRPGSPNSHTEVSLGLTLRWADMSADGVVTAGIWKTLNWRDSRTSWNKRQFKGAKRIFVDTSEIWVPDVVLNNRRDGDRLMRPCRVLGHCGDVSIFHDGSITLILDEVVQFKCKDYFQRTRSIWDDFECDLEYSFWSSGKDGLRFSKDTSKVRTGDDFDASSLELAGKIVATRYSDNRLTFKVPFRRKFTVQKNEQIFWNPLNISG